MQIGKLTSLELKEIVFSNLHSVRKENVRKPGLGEDVSVLNMESDLVVLSTDPITASTAHIGTLAVEVNINDLAAGGAEPVGILVTALIPPSTEKQELENIVKELQASCDRYGIDILGGHTEVTDSVNRVVLSVTAVGRSKKVFTGVEVNDHILMSKELGIEGSLILLQESQKLFKELTDENHDVIKNLKQKLSVLKESRVAREFDVHFMHDITEGGLIGALSEVVEAKGFGAVLKEKEIKLSPFTKELSEILSFSPYHFLSSGCLLIFVKEEEVDRLLNKMHQEGIEVHDIGVITKESGIYIQGKRLRKEEAKQADELYAALERL